LTDTPVIYPKLARAADGGLQPAVAVVSGGVERELDAASARELAAAWADDQHPAAIADLRLHADIADVTARALDAHGLLASLDDDLASEHAIDYAIEAGWASESPLALSADVVEVLRADALMNVASLAPAITRDARPDGNGTRWANLAERDQAAAFAMAYAYIGGQKAARALER